MDTFKIKNNVLKEYVGAQTEVNVPHGVEEIGAYAFWNSGVERVRLPESVKCIHEYAFSGCRALKEIELPESITSIGANAFSGTALQRVCLPPNIQVLREGVFSSSRLQEISVPKSVTKIESQAFCYCTQLERVQLPEGLASIGYKAFADNYKLREIRIPAGTRVEGGAFRYCNALADENGFVVVNGMLFQSPAFYRDYEVFLPDSVRVITSGCIDVRWDINGVIWACNRQELWDAKDKRVCSVVHIPASVERIESSAFVGDILHIVSESKAKFGIFSLKDCEKLQTLTLCDRSTVSPEMFCFGEEGQARFEKLKINYREEVSEKE